MSKSALAPRARYVCVRARGWRATAPARDQVRVPQFCRGGGPHPLAGFPRTAPRTARYRPNRTYRSSRMAQPCRFRAARGG
jgi:hypothetical protein